MPYKLQVYHGTMSQEHHSTLPLIYTCMFMSMTALLLFSAKHVLRLRFKRSGSFTVFQERIVHSMDVAAFLVSWYAISIGMTMFNKWFLKHWQGGYPFAITMSCIHMVLKFFLSRVSACCARIQFQRLPKRAFWM